MYVYMHFYVCVRVLDEFRSKVACHNDIAQLECNPYSRIAVYSASFGRTEYESIQCPQPQGVHEESKRHRFIVFARNSRIHINLCEPILCVVRI